MLHLLLFMAFTYYKTVTIAHTQCGTADSTDFPVAIWVTDADLKTVANGGKVQNNSGYDIRPYADSGLTIALTYELVASVYSPTTGTLEIHVKIPTVSHTSDTLFYLAFGDSGISTDGSSTATWDSNFSFVTHFPNGSSLSLSDSSPNGNNLTNSGGTAATGQIDGGIAFAGGSEFASISNKPSGINTPGGTGCLSVTFWVKNGDTSQANKYACSIFNDLAQTSIGYDITTPNHYQMFDGTSVYDFGLVNDTNWHKLDLTLTDVAQPSPLALNLYVDGGNVLNTTASQGPRDAVFTAIGNYDTGGHSAYFNGTLDELRVSIAIRSADWLLSEYNNQKSGSTFLTFGALTPVGGSTDNVDWLRKAQPLVNYRPTWINVP